MATIKQSCPCGAYIEIKGKDVLSCSYQSREFLEAHHICRKHGVQKQWEIEDEKSDLE